MVETLVGPVQSPGGLDKDLGAPSRDQEGLHLLIDVQNPSAEMMEVARCQNKQDEKDGLEFRLPESHLSQIPQRARQRE